MVEIMKTKHVSHHRRRWIFYILAGILLIYAIAGFVAVPMVAEKKLPEIAASSINGRVTIRDIDFKTFFFSALTA